MYADRRTTRRYCSTRCKNRSPERMEYQRNYLKTEKSRARHREYDRARYANNPTQIHNWLISSAISGRGPELRWRTHDSTS